MGENRFFFVESKSFEIAKNALELSLIERSRNHVSIVTMGFVAALWLRDVLLEVAKMSNDQNLFRSFREGNKIFVLQKQRNGKGRFVTITTLGESKNKKYVIIPEGRDASGWQGLSREINALMAASTVGSRDVNHRRPQPANMNIAGDRGTFAAIVSGQGRVHVEGNGKGKEKIAGEGLKITENLQSKQKLTLNLEQLDTGQIFRDSATVNLCLNIQIGCGPDGVWGIRSSSLVSPIGDSVLGPSELARQVVKPTALKEPVNKPSQPIKTNKLIWRPRAGAGPSEEAGPCLLQTQREAREAETALPSPCVGAGPSTADDPCPPRGQRETRASETPLPESSTQLNRMVHGASNQDTPSGVVNLDLTDVSSEDGSASASLPMVPIQDDSTSGDLGEGDSLVDRAWGTSKEWFLELKDGKRIRIPEGIRSITPLEDDRLTRRVQQWIEEQRYGGSESTEEEKKWVGLDKDLALVTKEDSISEDEGEAMVVAPLAVMMPSEVEAHGLTEIGPQTYSEWVLQKHKAFGKLVGASYEGYEERVLEVLVAIDARRRKVGPSSRKSTPSGKRGTRELKGLVSTINYEARGSQSLCMVQGGASLLT